MTITTRDRDYWNREIDNLINAKVQQILEDEGHPDFYNEMKQVARELIVNELDIGPLFDQLEQAKEQKDQLQAALKSIKEQYEQQIKDIGSVITAVESGIAARIYGIPLRDVDYHERNYYNNALDTKIDERKKKLIETSALGIKIRKIKDQKATLKRSIMLVNSPKEMQELMRSIYAKFGAPLMED